MTSKWRSRLTGAHDEFSERGTELTSEQREHLTRVTDELLKRYSISRSTMADGVTEEANGERVSATELGAVLESVLAEAFDFGWFTRADLPEAPELALELMENEHAHSPAPGADAGHVAAALSWPDPSAEADEAAESAADWSRGLGPPIAVEPVPESELDVEPDVEPEPEVEPDVEPEPEAEHEAEPAADREPPVLSDAEIEIAELEEIHRAAVDAERAAILFAAATRQRLAQARERWERTGPDGGRAACAGPMDPGDDHRP